MWDILLINPIFNLLIVLYKLTGNPGNLGIAIIIFTLIAKTILIPITMPSLKMAKKQRDVQPELDKIKQKFKYDKKKQAELQMELFRKHGINPGTGCITTIITFVLMIAIYRVIAMVTPISSPDGNYVDSLNQRMYSESLKLDRDHPLNTNFIFTDLSKPVSFLNDPSTPDKGTSFQSGALIITILAVLTQFIATKMMSPYSKTASKAVKQTAGQKDDIMQAMQKQNLYVMPVMFFIFGLKLPAGVMLYILISTVYQVAQTYFFSGWGGLKPWINKLKFDKKEM